MRLPDKQNASLSHIAEQLRGLTKELLQGLKASGDAIEVSNKNDVFASLAATQLFLVEEGQLLCEQNQKNICIIEAGDLIGLGRSLQLPEGLIRAEDTVRLIPYHRDELFKHVNSSELLQKHWAFYLVCQAAYYREALAQEMPKQFKPATGFLNFDDGDVIISQGDEAECVYTMLEGSADVFHDDIKVGEIGSEEIFGAMAVFTRQHRNATVKATGSCSVLAVKKGEFLDLVAHQPQVCLSLVEEMADKINQLNKQVLKLQK